MVQLTREEAANLIAEIRVDNGGISPEDRADTKPSVLRALANVRRKLGAATKTLATNLYSTDTRFVYELIQNAEDNEYTEALKAGEEPYLGFSIYPDRIVLESNEDGFAEANVRAICSTGESTKTVTQGYIGEKGIGFKSVFKVARKVHIQSGPFSFSFEHTRDTDDDGLGMVTPLNEPYSDLPKNVRTRITMMLLAGSSFHQRVEDIQNVPETTLLFLTKLKVLKIDTYPEIGPPTRVRYTRKIEPDGRIEKVIKATINEGDSRDVVKKFHVSRKELRDLPPDNARKLTNTATVVLAFPIDDEEEPIIEQQHVFAYLPLRLAGFSFLIQSDFITQASREDVSHCDRNNHILTGVAQAFRDAVLDFCHHPHLQWTWMRYLPSENIPDAFWSGLRRKIITFLKEARCVRSMTKRLDYLPHQLRRVNPTFQDRQGKPLCVDIDPEIYLSSGYTYDDFCKLAPLGVSAAYFNEYVPRIKADLARSDSRMKAPTTDEDWHTKMSEFLTTPFTKSSGWTTAIESVKSLAVIPLRDGTWVSANSGPIFLPKSGSTLLPTDLGLKIVQPSAVANAARKTLFTYLGVKSADPKTVIELIIRRNRDASSGLLGNASILTLPQSVSHYRYLFHHLPKSVTELDKDMWIFNSHGHTVSLKPNGLWHRHVYFDKEKEEYGARQMLASQTMQDQGLELMPVHFLHADYSLEMPVGAMHHDRTWEEWLCDIAKVHHHPQLLKRSEIVLSDEFKFIINHRSDKLVGLLKRHWSSYKNMTEDIKEKIKQAIVPVEGDEEIALHDAFLPTPEAKSAVTKLLITKFPFVLLPEKLTQENKAQWQFLETFDVMGCNGPNDVSFYIEALVRLADENQDQCSPDHVKALFKVYNSITSLCAGDEVKTTIKKEFDENFLIYIPPPIPDETGTWVCAEECVWSAPEWLKVKQRLNGVLDYATLQHFFCNILQIPNASALDFVDELKALQAEKVGDLPKLHVIYKALHQKVVESSSQESLRDTFEASQLVYVPSKNAWSKPSDCIWADRQAKIPGKNPIATDYAILHDFFSEVLNVQQPDLSMHVQALRDVAQGQPAASELKKMIMAINSMNPTTEALADLRGSNIFFVNTSTGLKRLMNSSSDFAIMDREEYGEAFAGKIDILDYSIEEVRACRKFLQAMELGSKHLSLSVEEKTTVQDGNMVQVLSQSFRNKAYGLYRCAVHHDSRKPSDGSKSLYDTLLNAAVYTSDGISKSLNVMQNGKTFTVEKSTAKLHLEEIENNLHLYVPKDPEDQEECFNRHLPKRLRTFMAIADPTAEAILTQIMACTSLRVLDNILKDAGIIEVEGVQRRPVPGVVVPESGPASSDNLQFNLPDRSRDANGRSSSASCTSTSSYPSFFDSNNSGVSTPTRPHPSSASSPFGSGLYTPSSVGFTSPSDNSSVSIAGYTALLDRIITSAARVVFPRHGTSAFDYVAMFSPPVSGASIFTTRSLERDRMVGAAGELFVFEFLLSLHLPAFDRQNWRSTIRREVRVHEKYRDMTPWWGSETADLVYQDTQGTLTSLLTDKGYLNEAEWQNVQPTYYLEVKTTPRNCAEQFYMSALQYKRMKRMRLTQKEGATDIYVLLRVFNLEGTTGLQIYVDTWSSPINEVLTFTADTWAVKPTSALVR
ncbi:hypothetical protein MMC25_003863 [Agyrium rufum]|nr:hypothetical protein [Agyrium rufum]